MIRQTLTAFCLALASALPVAAHEFWIDPDPWQVPAGGEIRASIRVGEAFEGPGYAYLPPNITRFELVMGEEVYEVPGRPGDRPALQMPAPEEGLAVIVHQTRDYDLTYENFQTFASFVVHKDADWALSRFVERGLDRGNIRERYTRYAKSLVAVGSGAGADREVGLRTEIVAEANPYTDDLSEGLPVRVLYEGAPREGAQIELFARAPDGTVEVQFVETDAEGRAVLPVRPGHAYLADAVVIGELEVSGPEDPAWESLWASLTFRVPG
ncbi:DUF4198 domain-containing protein [Roseivivax sp. GX 12232]|uniref:DUF4198 domain-containing protein n=1 Tax=Roseivivax sp. GX 12232 TaxID=2900547 RepID=UPI001E38348A|nr:DUF4198 domain-containing protein [Roseivivax sp. GX 12232]MCE0507055.1 DUF4198 domain-containing protein [Roseivivax sp. GX 12232]